MLSECLLQGRAFPWRKIGLVFKPEMDGWTHGSHPCALPLSGNEVLVAVTCRDIARRSHIYLARASVTGDVFKFAGELRHALAPGAPGTFDCDGVISVSFVRHESKTYLYYVGWQNLPEGMWICDTGRAVVDIDTLALTKEFDGPVLGRDKQHPLFAAATAFSINNGLWHAWYNSGISWSSTPTGWTPKYGIHHATSLDGVTWVCEPGLVLPFKDEHEYAFGRPCVVRRDGRYFMWFAHRASVTAASYRIGFASSADGVEWERRDDLAGIDVSLSGWDSEMICYPYVFELGGRTYMFYNGNSYGKTGFGLAVLGDR